MATARIRSTCPRTNAPRRRSISVQVSRTFFRLGRGISEHTTSTVLSRSKIQYAAAANVKKMPITTSNAFLPIPTAGFTSSDRFGRSARRFLSAVRIWCLTPVEFLAARATCALPLGLSAWSTWCSAAGTAKASAHGDGARQREIVQRETGRPRYAVPREPVDRRTQRGCNDHRREEEADDEAELPNRERRHDDPDDHQGHHRRALRRLDHASHIPIAKRLRAPMRTSVRVVQWPSHGSRRTRRPRRPGAQPEGHHGPAPAERPHLHHRAFRFRQVEPCLRHDLRRGAASLRRVALCVRAAVPADDGEAGRRLDRRPQPGDLDRPEDDVAEPALDGRHGHRDLRLPAPALRAGRPSALPDRRPADHGAVDRLDRRGDPVAAGRDAVHGQRAGRARPERASTGSCSSRSGARASRASRSTASSTRSRSRRRSTRSSSTRSRSSSTGS